MGQGGFEAAAEQLAVAHKENRSGARVIGQDPVPEASADLCATRFVQNTNGQHSPQLHPESSSSGKGTAKCGAWLELASESQGRAGNLNHPDRFLTLLLA